MEALAKRIEGRSATRWGAGLTGVVDGLEIAIAEHEVPGRSAETSGIWYVLLAWRIVGTAAEGAHQRPDSGNPGPHGGQFTHDGEWVAWRLSGLTKTNVERLLTHLPEVLRRF